MKLDADDQERLRLEEMEKIKNTAKKGNTPRWEQSPSEIADDIATSFFPVTSLSHAALRRHIIKAIEAERKVAEHYMTQMGRWWSNLNGL